MLRKHIIYFLISICSIILTITTPLSATPLIQLEDDIDVKRGAKIGSIKDC